MSANIGWLFWKDYFKDLKYKKSNSSNENKITKHNETIVEEKVINLLLQTPDINPSLELGNIHIAGTTTYPGLLLGSGNAHELPSVKGQLILGFNFDYTNGLPVIQGSSIKGVIRSAFSHEIYIKELLEDDAIDIKLLENEIFNNNDIFFDAEIIQANTLNNLILGDDYITPHKEEMKDPIPHKFLKVLPDVTFRFDFQLHDGLITKEEKSILFKNILEDLGLGAKTNVGYGNFSNFTTLQTEKEKKEEVELKRIQKEQEEYDKAETIKKRQEEKAQKAEGVHALNDCNSIKEAMKILSESFGKKPKILPEQKEIINNFWNKHKNNAVKSEIKFFNKFI